MSSTATSGHKPAQGLHVDLSRMQARPRSGVVIRNIRVRG